MTTQSLSDVLNDLAGGRAAVFAQDMVLPEAMSEESLFMEQDSLLAALHRTYLNARAHHAAARREHGADSPMTDIAADALDSAWCAKQTRLMEVRGDGALMRLIQSKMREAARAEQQARQDENDKRALDFFYRIETARLIKEKNKTPAIYEWLALFIIFHHFLRLPFPALGISDRRMAA